MFAPVFALLSALLASAPATAAPPAPAAPAVEELVAAALARSPALAALRAQVMAAAARESPAAALPDPTAEAAFQDVGFPRYTVGKDENSVLGIEVRQGLPYPGKRAARRAAAHAETAEREAELAQAERATAAQVRAAYARLYALDGEEASLAAAAELLDLLSTTASARYSAGQGEQEALVRSQIEVSRLAERRADLAAERAGAVADLNRLLDRPGAEPIGQVFRLPEVTPPALPGGGWEELAIARSAEVATAEARIATAERRLAMTRLDLRPDLSAGAGFGYRGSFDPMVTLRFGVEIPFWRRQKQEPRIVAAEAELAATREQLREARAAARATAARLAARWQTADLQIRRFREGILPQTSVAVDAARASYLAGRGDFTTVAQDFQLWLDARAQLARREADRYLAWAELTLLTQSLASAREGAQP